MPTRTSRCSADIRPMPEENDRFWCGVRDDSCAPDVLRTSQESILRCSGLSLANSPSSAKHSHGLRQRSVFANRNWYGHIRCSGDMIAPPGSSRVFLFIWEENRAIRIAVSLRVVYPRWLASIPIGKISVCNKDRRQANQREQRQR